MGDKEIENVEKKGLRVGASSMQGWRNAQEDAHSVELELTPNVSLFAVYDGHGGHEVAQWSALALPKLIAENLLKHNEKLDTFEEKLKELFIQHDEKILSEEVISELHKLAGRDLPPSAADEMKEELDDLEAEAEMTQEELLAKYGINGNDFAQQKVTIRNMFLSSYVRLEDDEDEDSDETEEPSSKLSENESLESDKENIKAENINSENVEGESSKNEKPKQRDRRRLSAEERAKKLEEANDQNGCGGVVLEDHPEASSEASSEDDAAAQDQNMMLRGEEQEICGQDSGTTCILTLLQHETKELLVGNIGDSRAVLCRAGAAVELSFDHKPEDEIELTRIKNAGGYLTGDGRVKGGLNLSRAFGDHIYKDNSQIPLKDQMITALPDVKHIKLTDEDEFLILACDGIWNVMTSQEAIDFVRDRLEKDSVITDILGEMFDLCIAPDTSGDGSGCDNMTAMVVHLKNKSQNSKRPRSDEETETAAKVAKV